MKFNYFDPSLSKIVDKYEFKQYIKEYLGDGYTIPLIGVLMILILINCQIGL